MYQAGVSRLIRRLLIAAVAVMVVTAAFAVMAAAFTAPTATASAATAAEKSAETFAKTHITSSLQILIVPCTRIILIYEPIG